MAGGRMWLNKKQVAGPPPAAKSNATNIVYKKKIPNKDRKKALVATSFQKAFNKMLPVKVIREELTFDMWTSVLSRLIMSRNLVAVAQGPQINQRLGNAIYVSAVKLKGTLQNNGVSKLRYLRLTVISEHNEGHLTTGFTDYYLNASFADNTPDGTSTDGIFPVNREQYVTHYDHTYKILPEVRGGVLIDVNIKIGKVIYFPQANAASVNPVRGRIYVVANLYEGDDDTNVTLTNLALSARVFFKDYRKMY